MTDNLDKFAWHDLGLTYEQAAHGMQTAVAFSMNTGRSAPTEPKHLRTGINLAMSDHAGLAYLLIRKDVISEDEYREALRQAANHEVWRCEQLYPRYTFR